MTTLEKIGLVFLGGCLVGCFAFLFTFIAIDLIHEIRR